MKKSFVPFGFKLPAKMCTNELIGLQFIPNNKVIGIQCTHLSKQFETKCKLLQRFKNNPGWSSSGWYSLDISNISTILKNAMQSQGRFVSTSCSDLKYYFFSKCSNRFYFLSSVCVKTMRGLSGWENKWLLFSSPQIKIFKKWKKNTPRKFDLYRQFFKRRGQQEFNDKEIPQTYLKKWLFVPHAPKFSIHEVILNFSWARISECMYVCMSANFGAA